MDHVSSFSLLHLITAEAVMDSPNNVLVQPLSGLCALFMTHDWWKGSGFKLYSGFI